MWSETPRFRRCGDTGLLVELGDIIDPEVHQRVHHFSLAVQEHLPAAIKEIVPAYRSILVIYDPLLVSEDDLKKLLSDTYRGSKEYPLPASRLVEIPVVYGGEYGPDLEFVAHHAGLTCEEVIRIHGAPEYLVYMFGFSPGFPLLGGLDERLCTPRLETPRSRTPQGSVGIANYQTGIYSLESPGGWRIIGRTPLRLYRPDLDPPVLVRMGDFVRFRAISREDYDLLLKNHKNSQEL